MSDYDYHQIHEQLAMMHLEALIRVDYKRCLWGEPMLWLPCDRAVAPGHIYSEAGLREARISGSCEYHFDKMFKPGWTDIITKEAGQTPADD